MAILIIEDELSIAELQRDYLEIAGYEVVIENDGEKGCQKAMEDDFELVIVDIMLPGKNGFEICRELRKEKEMPLLVVSAKAGDIDKVRALGLGADDYMVKPFSPNELVARVQAHIARYERLRESFGNAESHRAETLCVGDICLNMAARTLEKAGKEIYTTNKEFDLLYLLMQNLDCALSKEEILMKVWGIDAFVETATVAVHVNRLREKIENDPANPKHILTVWGIGYRFVP